MQNALSVLPFNDAITFLLQIAGLCIFYACLQVLQLIKDSLLKFIFNVVFLIFIIQFVSAAIGDFLILLERFVAIYATIYPLLLTVLTLLQSLLAFVSISPAFIAINSIYVVVIERFLVPMLITSLLLTICSLIYPTITFHRFAQLLRKVVLLFLSLYMLLYTSILAISTALIKSATNVGSTLRKLFEQNIPLIGSILTEITSLMKQFQFVASSTVGLIAFIISALLLFTPVVSLFLYSSTLYIAAAIVEPFIDNRYAQIIEEFAKTMFVMTAVAFIFMSQLFVTVIIFYIGVSFR